MKAYILILYFILWNINGFKVQHYDNEDTANDELVLLFQMTRHGARSPTHNITTPDILKNSSNWKNGFGQLTAIGERQHYLLAAKHKKKYKDFLSNIFDPNEIYIVSTGYNRTIMSAYSEITAWYPLGDVKSLTNDQRKKALPPFNISDKYDVIRTLGTVPTAYGFQPIPVHVGQNTDEMLLAMDEPVCPSMSKYREEAKKDEAFQKVNDKYKDNILKDMKEKWGLEDTTDITKINDYVDYFYATYFDK